MADVAEQGRRFFQADVPLRYVARDRIMPGGRLQPQHAVWSPQFDPPRVTWVDHPQGATMSPFDGPEEEWQALIAGAKDLS